MSVRSHPEIIALLALMGRKKGHDIWVGRNEQGQRAGGLAPDGPLSQLVTVRPQKLDGVANLRAVLDMDLLWIKGGEVKFAFEVEATTTMTGGLLRGSNLPPGTPKFMVLPEERDDDLARKMESPLFREHFEGEKWSTLYFGFLRQSYTRTKDRTTLEELRGRKADPPKARAVRESEQRYLDL
jgi:hypothetical protein